MDISMEKDPSWRDTSCSASREFRAFYGNRVSLLLSKEADTES